MWLLYTWVCTMHARLNSTPVLLGNSTPHYWVVLVIVWLHSQTGSQGIKRKAKLLNDQSPVNSARVTLLQSSAEIM